MCVTQGSHDLIESASSPIFVLQFAFNIIQEVEEREKRERPGNTRHMNDIRWTRG